MDLEHSFIIPVPPEQAWQALLDVEQVAPCMPGATVDSVDGEVISGKIKIKVGPVQMTYAGKARFTEQDEATKTVVLEASGKETRGSGTASATIRSSLQDENGQTRVLVRTTMTVTGRPAQFGRGVMAEVGGRIIGKFATNLAAQLSGEGTPAASADEAAGAAAASSEAASTPAGSGDTADAPAAGAGAAAAAAASSGDEGGVNGLAADAAQLPIEELGLPVRSFNSLRREGVHTVGGLAARTEKELLAIDGLGPQSIKEIKSRLADHGLALTTPGVTADETAAGSVAAGTASTGTASPGTASTGTAAGTAAPAGTAPATAASGGAASGGAASGGAASGGAASAGAAPGTAGTGVGGPRPAAVSPDTRTGTWDAGTAAPDRSAANGLLPPRSSRPQDEDALDLLSVAGLPLLKRVAPAAGFLLVAVVVFRVVRRRRRASRA
jgi:carbon monoxide dehydrogenase subunit G